MNLMNVDFNPLARPLFKPAEFFQIVVSDIGVALWFAAMYYWVQLKGWNHMLSYYFVPYLWVNQYVLHTPPH